MAKCLGNLFAEGAAFFRRLIQARDDTAKL